MFCAKQLAAALEARQQHGGVMAQPPATSAPQTGATPRGHSLPDAPMAFAPQDLSKAGPAEMAGLFWRIWAAIAPRARP